MKGPRSCFQMDHPTINKPTTTNEEISKSISMFAPECRQFLEMTSIRGIPRILKSRSRGSCFIWLVAVITCTALLAWQLFVAFQLYFQYPINTVVMQISNTAPTFPDLTICSRPQTVTQENMSLQFEEYLEVLNQQLTLEAINVSMHGAVNESNIADIETVIADFNSPDLFLNMFPIRTNITYDPNDSPIIDYQYFDWNWDSYGSNYSNDIHVNTLIPYIGSCYTISLNKVRLKNKFYQTLGLSVILYVEELPAVIQTLPSLSAGSSMTSSLWLIPHETGLAPEIQLPVLISPGTETSIVLDATLRRRLPAPYSNCTTQEHLANDSAGYTYSQLYCYDICHQQQIINACGCYTTAYMATEFQLMQTNYTGCGNLSLTSATSQINWAGFASYLCFYKFVIDNEKCDCPLRCTEFQYTSSINFTPWPTVSSQLAFYKTYIEGKPRFGNLFDGYKNVEERALATNMSLMELLSELDQQGLIRDRFLQLDFSLDSILYDELSDQAAFPLNAFGAQIGGILSLWLGVTLMFLVELIELLYTLLSKSCSAACEQHNGAAVAQADIPMTTF